VDNERDVIVITMDQIRAYFELNPDAADTVDGVMCWLIKDHPPVRSEIICAALDRLVAEGEVRSEILPGGKVLYRRRRAAPDLQ
jgi:hypothetical protein